MTKHSLLLSTITAALATITTTAGAALPSNATTTIATTIPATTSTPISSTIIPAIPADTSGSLTNLAFNSLDLGYISAINTLDLGLLQQLASSNSLDLSALQANMFGSSVFDVNALLQLQQLQMLLQLCELGIFGGASVASVAAGQDVNAQQGQQQQQQQQQQAAVDLSGLDLASPLQLGIISSGIGGFDLGSLIDESALAPQLTAVVQQSGEILLSLAFSSSLSFQCLLSLVSFYRVLLHLAFFRAVLQYGLIFTAVSANHTFMAKY